VLFDIYLYFIFYILFLSVSYFILFFREVLSFLVLPLFSLYKSQPRRAEGLLEFDSDNAGRYDAGLECFGVRFL